MNVKEVEAKGLKRILSVEVPVERLREKALQYIAEKGKTYRMAGFRPGKVPPAKLEELFGASALDQAAKDIVQETAREVLRDRDLKPAQKPVYVPQSAPKALRGDDAPLVYHLEFEVTPDIPALGYDTFQPKAYSISVTEEAVKKKIKEIANLYKDTQPLKKNRAAEPGDVIVADMRLTTKGQQDKIHEGEKFLLDKKELGEELSQLLTGMNVGDEIAHKVAIPKSFPDREVAGKKILTHFHIRELHERVPSEIDEAFAKRLGFESLKAFKTHVQKELEKHGEEATFLWLKRQALDYFAKAYDFPVPERMVAEEYQKVWTQTLKELGIDNPAKAPKVQKDRDALFQEALGKTEAELRDFYQKVSERRVRLGFVLADLGRQWDIKVSSDELQELVRQEIMRHPHQQKEIMNYYKNYPQALAELQAPLFEEKVVKTLLEKIKMPGKSDEISLEELQKKLEAEELVLE